MQVIQGQGGIKTMEQLMEAAMVVAITAHRVGEQRQIDPDSVGIATFNRQKQDETPLTDEEKKTLSLGKKVFQSKAVSDIRALDRAFAEKMRRIALSSPLKAGHYLVARSRLQEVDGEIVAYRKERDALKKVLKDTLEDVIKADKERLPKHLFNRDDYPDEDELERRVYLHVEYTTYNTPKNLKSISQEVYEREVKRAERECSQLMSQLRDGLRGSMHKLFSTLHDQLGTKPDGTKRRVYKNTLANLREFLTLFEAHNFAGDTELKQIVDKTSKLLSGVDVDGLREDETMRATLDKGFEQLAVQVSALTETVSARRYAIG